MTEKVNIGGLPTIVAMLKKISLFGTALLLAACAAQPELSVPQVVGHNNRTYYLAAQQDLGSMARYFYVTKEDTPQDWKSAVELLLDRNRQQRTLDDRIQLRRRVYQNTAVPRFDLYRQDDVLYGFVIYPPSAQNKDWRVDVSKGKDVPLCGFIQYQYSVKIAKNKKLMNMSKSKIVSYLKKYVADKEMAQLKQTSWPWSCEK